ncbi:hypothetical protein AMTRI_Chr07g26330 [Amborella trichopoda]
MSFLPISNNLQSQPPYYCNFSPLHLSSSPLSSTTTVALFLSPSLPISQPPSFLVLLFCSPPSSHVPSYPWPPSISHYLCCFRPTFFHSIVQSLFSTTFAPFMVLCNSSPLHFVFSLKKKTHKMEHFLYFLILSVFVLR